MARHKKRLAKFKLPITIRIFMVVLLVGVVVLLVAFSKGRSPKGEIYYVETKSGDIRLCWPGNCGYSYGAHVVPIGVSAEDIRTKKLLTKYDLDPSINFSPVTSFHSGKTKVAYSLRLFGKSDVYLWDKVSGKTIKYSTPPSDADFVWVYSLQPAEKWMLVYHTFKDSDRRPSYSFVDLETMTSGEDFYISSFEWSGDESYIATSDFGYAASVMPKFTCKVDVAFYHCANAQRKNNYAHIGAGNGEYVDYGWVSFAIPSHRSFSFEYGSSSISVGGTRLFAQKGRSDGEIEQNIGECYRLRSTKKGTSFNNMLYAVSEYDYREPCSSLTPLPNKIVKFQHGEFPGLYYWFAVYPDEDFTLPHSERAELDSFYQYLSKAFLY